MCLVECCYARAFLSFAAVVGSGGSTGSSLPPTLQIWCECSSVSSTLLGYLTARSHIWASRCPLGIVAPTKSLFLRGFSAFRKLWPSLRGASWYLRSLLRTAKSVGLSPSWWCPRSASGLFGASMPQSWSERFLTWAHSLCQDAGILYHLRPWKKSDLSFGQCSIACSVSWNWLHLATYRWWTLIDPCNFNAFEETSSTIFWLIGSYTVSAF
jgi:hypothetical protein